MAEIVIHAGMPKTGSSSIQVWLQRNRRALADEGTVFLVDETLAEGSGLRPAVDAPARAPGGGLGFVLRYERCRVEGRTADGEAEVERFTAQLDALARHWGRVVLSAESLAATFSRPERPVLAGLAGLTAEHEVRVAYYVRPQHEAIEARWRQWGYLADRPVSAWIEAELHHLDYRQTARHCDEHATGVDVLFRPFRRDLLTGGDAVVDFARVVLGTDVEVQPGSLDENPSFPLDLAILLRGETPRRERAGLAGSAPRQAALARLVGTWDVEPSPAAVESRAILHRFAHARFAAGNAELARRCGWTTDALIEPPSDPHGPASLEAVAARWERPVDPTALAYLRRALLAITAPG